MRKLAALADLSGQWIDRARSRRSTKTLQMAEVAVPRDPFRRILGRIARLRPPDLAPC
jgi:hypothetical protein